MGLIVQLIKRRLARTGIPRRLEEDLDQYWNGLRPYPILIVGSDFDLRPVRGTCHTSMVYRLTAKVRFWYVSTQHWRGGRFFSVNLCYSDLDVFIDIFE